MKNSQWNWRQHIIFIWSCPSRSTCNAFHSYSYCVCAIVAVNADTDVHDDGEDQQTTIFPLPPPSLSLSFHNWILKINVLFLSILDRNGNKIISTVWAWLSQTLIIVTAWFSQQACSWIKMEIKNIYSVSLIILNFDYCLNPIFITGIYFLFMIQSFIRSVNYFNLTTFNKCNIFALHL